MCIEGDSQLKSHTSYSNIRVQLHHQYQLWSFDIAKVNKVRLQNTHEDLVDLNVNGLTDEKVNKKSNNNHKVCQKG